MAGEITFSDFRLAVASDLMDGLALEATADGSETTFIDDLNLVDGFDQFRSSFGVMIAATNSANVGRIVRVDSSSPDTTSITFAGSGLPAATMTGDVMHLFNLGGYGFRPQFYDLAIREGIRASFPDFMEEAVSGPDDQFSADNPLITVPQTMVAVYALEMEEETNIWRTVPHARDPGKYGDGWSVDRANGQLRVDGEWQDTMDGLEYRLRGYQRPTLPTIATDTISVDLLWLTYEVKARLSARRRSDRQLQQWGVEWGRLAADARQRIVTPREPDTEFL